MMIPEVIVMIRISIAIILFSTTTFASDPVRMATDSEIEKHDPNIVLSMGLEKVVAPDEAIKNMTYEKFARAEENYFSCVSNNGPQKMIFHEGRLIATFELPSTKSEKKVKILFSPKQQNKFTAKCIADKLKILRNLIDYRNGVITGDLTFEYKKAMKFDINR